MIQVQNVDLHAHTFVKCGDVHVHYEIIQSTKSLKAYTTMTVSTILLASFSTVGRKISHSLKLRVQTCTCIASYHHVFKTLFARKPQKIASVMID